MVFPVVVLVFDFNESSEEVLHGHLKSVYMLSYIINFIFASVPYRTNVGVFFCGPAGLSHTLHKMANEHSDTSSGVKFLYNKENF
jgi:hypothetical protein